MGHRAPHRRGIARPISCAILRCSSKAASVGTLRRRLAFCGMPRLACFSDARERCDAVQALCKPVGATIGRPLLLGCGAGDRWSPLRLWGLPTACSKANFSRIHQILQNLFAFVIFLSHSFGILISVKGNPPRHQRMPPTTARLRWNRTGTCIAAFPLRFCMFAQTKRSHLCGCFSYFPPKKKAVYAAFFIFLMNLKNRPLRRSVFMHFFA